MAKIKDPESIREEREIQKIMDKYLPDSYGRTVFAEKTEIVFRHFYELAEQGIGFAA